MNSQLKTIQMFFDSVEVLRIEDGVKCYEVSVPANTQPNKIEMYGTAKSSMLSL